MFVATGAIIWLTMEPSSHIPIELLQTLYKVAFDQLALMSEALPGDTEGNEVKLDKLSHGSLQNKLAESKHTSCCLK